jgi:hypothetical protein
MAANKHDPHSEEQEFRAPDPNHPETLYEHRDVNTWAVGKFGIGLVLLTIVAIGLLIGVFKFFESRVGGPRPADELEVDARRLPPQPRLQSTPILDLEQVQAAEQRALNSYGWLDRSKGLVRIPVPLAMQMLAQRPPAARTQAETPVESGVSVPTESGLGPKMQRPGGPLADELPGTAGHEAAGHEAPAAPASAPVGRQGEKK